ncbi:MAG: hypothetical protein U0931_11165 [Vulcanimicrobiota bacterium]
MAIGPITNFTGAALDQQLFAVDARSAQSTLLNGNLFGALGGAQQSSLDAVFGGLGGLSFPPLGGLNFSAPPGIGFQAPAGIGFPNPGGISFQAPGGLAFQAPGGLGFQAPGPLGFQAPGALGFQAPGPLGFQAPMPLSFQIPQALNFAQSMLQSLGGLSSNWAGIMGGSGFAGFGAGQSVRGCH